ncbi:MAG: cation:proton antiporter [Pseudomonadota bacterium]
MDPVTVAILAGSFFLYALLSGRLERTPLTAPLLFATFGLVGGGVFDWVDINVQHSAIHIIAELTLILILFSDAARINLGDVRADHNLPTRMLVLGLPLAIGAGLLVALLLFPGFSIWEAALLAALLAPTDAALGQAVVSAPAVPNRIRQALNIESGLNDGIALPAVLFFAALASAGASALPERSWVEFALLQLTFGPVVGIILGWIGARLIDTTASNGWATSSFQAISVLSLAILAYVLAEMVGGNGFIATFVAGMVFGNTLRHPCTFLFEFMESEGQLLMLLTFVIFGAALLPESIAHINGPVVIYALLSLTAIRMAPIALSLLGSGVRVPTFLFLGWFGPRGLASILFVLLILEESEIAHRETIFAVTMVTVALSIVLHGLTAAPIAKRYGRRANQMGDCEEIKWVSTMPLRTPVSNRDASTTELP